MKAIVFAPGDEPGIAPLNERCPAAMLTLFDRPFIQHVVEYFAEQKVSEFLFVLHHFPERIEQCLGDGSRWGVRIHFQLARDPQRPYRGLKSMAFVQGLNEAVLFGHANRLPMLDLNAIPTGELGAHPLIISTQPAGEQSLRRFDTWSGWSIETPNHLATIPPDADELAVFQHLSNAATEERHWRETASVLDVRSYQGFLNSHLAVLDKKHTGLMLHGREVDPQIWLSRNVVLHPTVKITPPVYIAENCQIALGAKLGPYAVVGSDCLLDEHCTVTQAVIFPGSYVGEALELNEVIVDRNRLINARLGAAVTITDNFILGSMAERHVTGNLQRLLSRMMAGILLVLALPLFLATVLVLRIARSGPLLHRKSAVRLPTSVDEQAWRTFELRVFQPWEAGIGAAHETCTLGSLFCRLLPSLWAIVKGDLCFVGVPPRSAEELRELPPDWRALYVQSKTGVVTEASVRFDSAPNEDELFMAEAYYVATASWHYDLRLIVRYVGRCLFSWIMPRQLETPVEV